MASALPGLGLISSANADIPLRAANNKTKSSFTSSAPAHRFLTTTSGTTTKRKWSFKCRAGLEEIAPATAAVYGLTLLSGGYVAYSRTGSKGSLFGGLTGGLAFAVAYVLMLNPDTKDLANAIGFGAAFLFIAVFGIRFAATRKPLPSGLLLAISIAASVVFVNAYFSARLLS